MKKFLTLTLLGVILSAASYAILPIFGAMSTCVGSSRGCYDSTVGGTWSSSDVAIATIDTMGIAYGVSAGTSTITYTVGAAYVTAVFTVYPTPAPITGTTSVCTGATTPLSDASVGGTWSSGFTTIASVTGTGVVTGGSAGTATIYYMLSTGCYVTTTVTVGGTPPTHITGDSIICVGTTTLLSDGTTGGVWSSGTPAVATVSAGGTVTGVSAGLVTISYTTTSSCGSSYATFAMFVNPGGSAGTISGASTVVAGSTISLSSTVSGGTWSSSSTGIATVNASTGVVTGVSAGTTTITYTVTACGATYTATTTITVTAAPPPPPTNRISGYVNFGSAPLDTLSPIKVWLITYDTATHLLQAIDSVTTYSGGGPAYYQFYGEPTDSYRVKAAVFPVVFSSTGYMPTYHTSSSYWYSANVISHVVGTTDDGEDINMGYGTVTSGPGFIGGDVTTGANRGTSDGDPVAGMQIYIVSSTGSILQYTFTDAAGHYSFSNLPVGTYTIYPEAINYATTAYTNIHVTSGAPTMNAANFIQHTVSYKITPVTEGVNNVKSYVSSVIAFPNPTNGKLNIQWNESATEKATISISDITGREIMQTSVDMNEGTGSSILNLSGLTNGIYLITIKSNTINYNSKIELQH